MTDPEIQALVMRMYEAHKAGDAPGMLATSLEIEPLSNRDLVRLFSAACAGVMSAIIRGMASEEAVMHQVSATIEAHLMRRLETGERAVTR